MEIDEQEIYIRTLSDVRSMVNHAKLDEKKLTDITQAIYYPTINENESMDDIKLLELNTHLLNEIQNGRDLQFKGGLNETLVLCSSTKTFDVKEAEISNSVLLIPNLMYSQATSKSPLKSPKTNMANGSFGKDKSLEGAVGVDGEDIELLDTNRQLEHRYVRKIAHEYFECREINPRYRKLFDILQMTKYSGPENEYCIDRNLLFTKQQLMDTIQCSTAEFQQGLNQFRCIEINGRIRVLDVEYEYRTVSQMLALINENSWKLDEIQKNETLEALQGIAPEIIVAGLFDLYTEISERPQKYKYIEYMVCRIIAQNILQQGLKFHINDFLVTWQEALPTGMKINEKYLNGIGIIDRESSVPCVRSLIETNLSINLLERLKMLFATKEKWTLEQIEPYIVYFTTPYLSVTTILAKSARSLTVQGQRIYISKH